MKPHPRIRKTVKWGGLAVTVLFGLLWLGSAWLKVRWDGPPARYVLVSRGRIGYVNATKRSALVLNGFSFGVHEGSLDWKYEWVAIEPFGVVLAVVPLWIPTVLICAATAIAWRLDTLARHRVLLNRCPRCRYDRSGLAAGAVCPECGAGATQEAGAQ